MSAFAGMRWYVYARTSPPAEAVGDVWAAAGAGAASAGTWSPPSPFPAPPPPRPLESGEAGSTEIRRTRAPS